MESTQPGVLGAIRIDLARLHATWMELLFPRQLDPSRVLGKWRPETTAQKVGYYGWASVGVPLVAVGYPLLILGVLIRFNSRQLDSAGARLGVLGVVALSLVVWGGLTVLARFRFSQSGFLAVLAASLVATLAAGLAVVFARIGGRGTSVLLAYPSAMTALFLPPVVAALYSPSVAAVVFPGSQSLAVWLLDTVLTVGDLNVLLREQFDLRGVAYVGMWFGLAVPLGWLLGVVVTLADIVRPREDDTTTPI
ncbi:hypothetical protein SAMN04487949_0970 [Halogranum gelatinilyticum]|uniref:Uncharacterized protein n=1 Tax=Halogranum gelatinilyticum TaxID=660521 RepID=A0A1G9QQB3_9EURY|nr:hypothetical protein [Halogranum gelatinilyticum]SDM13021.1 hypothetical protein SAMN04487949_0970 [Halogranum gelatinilyticum]